MFKKILLAASLSLALFSPLAALAADDTSIRGGVLELKKNLQNFGGNTGLSDKSGQADLTGTVANIINVILGLLGVVAVIVLLVAGWRWMTAGGNEQTVTEAKAQIKNALYGLAIIFLAWVIAGFTINQLSDATGAGGGTYDNGGTTPPRSAEPDNT